MMLKTFFKKIDRECCRIKKCYYLCSVQMVSIAQLVRASDCGSEGRGFETLCSPQERVPESQFEGLFDFNTE